LRQGLCQARQDGCGGCGGDLRGSHTAEHDIRAREGHRATRSIDSAQRALATGRQRTQLIKAVRGQLSELGIVAARGLLALAELATVVRDESDQSLPLLARAALMVLVR